MIKRVRLKNFKRFEDEVFELADHVVLAGSNNAGKTTLIQAVNTWYFAFKRWLELRYRENGNTKPGPKKPLPTRSRTGAPITRKELATIPIREFSLLWTDTSTALGRDELGEGQKQGTPRVMSITLEGELNGEVWALTMEFRYANSELVYAKPSQNDMDDVPRAAQELDVVHVPPFSGIGPEETRLDLPYQQLLIGQGKAGDILRNLLWELFQQEPTGWSQLVSDVESIFGYRLMPPEYEGRPFILCDYLPKIPKGKGLSGTPRLDIASAGSGFQQVLLLLGFFYARPSALLLLDEPDAHLHVILQKEIYDKLRRAAASRGSQLIVATHSEVILEATSPNKVVSFYGQRPHVLINDVERDQVREALKRVTALDILLAEQSTNVLYVEDETDFDLLRAWARVLGHPLDEWFARKPFFHPMRGRNPKEAGAHFFALRAVKENLTGFILLDGDNRSLPDRELRTDGLMIGRWKRYEAESYLVHPAAIERFLGQRVGPLFASAAMSKLANALPGEVISDPISEHEYLELLPASKKLLPEIFEAAGIRFAKREYYQLAEEMSASELPLEVTKMLDSINAAFTG